MLDAARRVLCFNPAAQACGITPGLPAGSAQALAPALHCLPRQPRAERQSLEGLAAWSLRFSSWISLAPPAALLLEIGGSLKLFGSASRLRGLVAEGLTTLGHRARLGIAPTPRGAEVLARVEASALDLPALQQRLDGLPLEALGWSETLTRSIRAVGVRTIGELLALPRSGRNLRYGPQQGRELDQLLGRAADPRPAFRPPRRYRRRLEPAQETRDSQALLPGFERLFGDLAARLTGHDCGISALDIRLLHARQPPTALRLGLLAPSRDPARWLALLQEHFQRLTLPAEVRAIEVGAERFVSLGRTQTQLWHEPDAQDEQALLERLAARLGPSRLYGLGSCQSHAPEQAWTRTAAGAGHDAAADPRPRPLWLLPAPEAIEYAQLQLLDGPERLETRWWGEDCRRDYYRARDRQGRRLWVFRAHDAPACWFVHGVFG